MNSQQRLKQYYCRSMRMGAVPLIDGNRRKAELLSNGYVRFVESGESDARQLSFLWYAYSNYLRENGIG